jgi:hypothetical protein
MIHASVYSQENSSGLPGLPYVDGSLDPITAGKFFNTVLGKSHIQVVYRL